MNDDLAAAHFRTQVHASVAFDRDPSLAHLCADTLHAPQVPLYMDLAIAICPSDRKEITQFDALIAIHDG